MGLMYSLGFGLAVVHNTVNNRRDDDDDDASSKRALYRTRGVFPLICDYRVCLCIERAFSKEHAEACRT